MHVTTARDTEDARRADSITQTDILNVARMPLCCRSQSTYRSDSFGHDVRRYLGGLARVVPCTSRHGQVSLPAGGLKSNVQDDLNCFLTQSYRSISRTSRALGTYGNTTEDERRRLDIHPRGYGAVSASGGSRNNGRRLDGGQMTEGPLATFSPSPHFIRHATTPVSLFDTHYRFDSR
ncbi:hypothetical protein PHLGIDRAFT_182637 [Phlebiopsis gigantea 11061_1 CR5-6]|uniref:Uncharacterized protein n=1 Tax=Phlebiopsis gigantea (strain 11061_1 CR5-6) TaxID=745531 RepID=A0A0C3RUJ3_PHLG1|nr:hypothetical protein PHLGIDRAFT_182637 [Phlebiopsis gigantea 11061_1 CR5-6]